MQYVCFGMFWMFLVGQALARPTQYQCPHAAQQPRCPWKLNPTRSLWIEGWQPMLQSNHRWVFGSQKRGCSSTQLYRVDFNWRIDTELDSRRIHIRQASPSNGYWLILVSLNLANLSHHVYSLSYHVTIIFPSFSYHFPIIFPSCSVIFHRFPVEIGWAPSLFPGWREPWHLLLAALSILRCKRQLLLHLSPSQSGDKAVKLIMSATETEALAKSWNR